MDGYHIATSVFESQYTVKKSRFIARVVPIESRACALTAVDSAKKDFPDARHHCWAYLLGSPRDARSAGMNDDGEPAGTAGKPILNVMQHGVIGDVLVVVTRYFGGIKLGAGGLVRAYGTATQQALDATPTQLRRQRQEYQVRGDFGQEQMIRHWLTTVEGEMGGVEYAEQVFFQLLLPSTAEQSLQNFCAAHHMDLIKPEDA